MAKLATRIFISISFARREPRKKEMEIWVNRFKVHLCERFDYKPEEIYIFTDPHTAPPGAPIEREVAEKLRETDHLICVISDEYLSSPWCLKEYWEYIQRPDRQNGEDTLYIITKYLRMPDYATPEKIRTRIARAVEELKKKTVPPFDGPILEFATERWPEILFAGLHDKRHIRLVDEDEYEWSKALKDLATKLIRPKTRFLPDYAALSAYCLGADRYRNGGWGFSLPEDVTRYDDEDDDELPNGPYGLNVIILRALGHFLERKEFNEERLPIFESSNTRNAFQAARDRLPEFAALLACLENPELALVSLERKAQTAHGLLSGLESKSRWTLADISAATRSPQYLSMVLGCLSNAQDIRTSNPEHRWLLDSTGLSNHFGLIAEFHDSALEIVKETKNNLIELVSIAHNIKAENHDVGGLIRACILWLLLGGCSEGQKLLSELMFSYPAKQKQLIASLRTGILGNDPFERNVSVTISLVLCAATLHSKSPLQTDVQNLVYEEVFRKFRPCQIVPELNCAAWCAILAIAFSDAPQILEPKLTALRGLWKYGVNLRSDRLKVVMDSKPETLKTDLNRWKSISLLSHAEYWVEQIPSVRDPQQTQEEQKAEFIEALASARFWGPKPQNEELVSSSSSTTLSGVLRVNVSKNNRIELDSEGYRRMFLYPFSLITEMNVLNAHDIRREFGDDDRKLVKIMGETVVVETYIRDDKKDLFVRHKDGFIKRTEDITDKLKDVAWPSQNGMDDLLRVRKGPDNEETRWIYRSAMVSSTRRVDRDRVISWRFVEMPSIIQALIAQARDAA